jgi:hypothetical protein
MTYTQNEHLQVGRSIKKRNQRTEVVIWRTTWYEKLNLQILEVKEFTQNHWCIDFLKKNAQRLELIYSLGQQMTELVQER